MPQNHHILSTLSFTLFCFLHRARNRQKIWPAKPSFLPVKYNLVCHLILLPAKNREVEVSYDDRDLLLVLLPYTKLVYLTVVILDLGANILY